MNLFLELNKYINHKKKLADVSPYYFDSNILLSLGVVCQWQFFIKKQREYYKDRDIARIILNDKQHFINILPCTENKSYKSSLEKITQIIEFSTQILKPKTHEN